jgi:nucleoside-diphosphate-sugar epimerase
MRVLFIGGTGPVGLSSLPHLQAAGHELAVAHTGAHEPDAARDVEHLNGERGELLAPDGPAERWRPDAIIDTFAGGATGAKARGLGEFARRIDAARVVAVSSMDVYRHCADAGVDDNPPAELAHDPLPLSEDSPQREGPSPGGGAIHDNVAMEDALPGDRPVAILRPGAIYGPYDHPNVLREWYLVGKVVRGERTLQLPDGGTQLFHRVAVDRVGRAVAAAIERAPRGAWACNVADPVDFTYGGLARLVANRFGWEWDCEPVPWEQSDHPWNVRQPVFSDTTRLRETLSVTGPDPVEATLAQLDWLWANRDVLAHRAE